MHADIISPSAYLQSATIWGSRLSVAWWSQLLEQPPSAEATVAVHVCYLQLLALAPPCTSQPVEGLLLRALDDARWPLRDAAMETVAQLSPAVLTSSVRVLRRIWELLFADSHYDVRATAASVSAKIWGGLAAIFSEEDKEQSLILAVSSLLRDSEYNPRRAGVLLGVAVVREMLCGGQPGSALAVAGLLSSLRDDGDWEVCVALQQAVVSLASLGVGGACAAAAGGISVLLDHLRAPDRLTRLGSVRLACLLMVFERQGLGLVIANVACASFWS
jgi:hypothetical protein